MRAAALFLLALLSTMSFAESIYVVQSKTITDIYSDSIVKSLKMLRPNDQIEALFVRDFNQDRFSESKRITREAVRDKAEGHDNLIVIGYDVSFLFSEEENPIQIPVLVDFPEGASGPASPSSIISEVRDALDYTSASRGVVYVLSDSSNISRLRLRQFRSQLDEDKNIQLVTAQVMSTSDLRGQLISLNKRTRGVLINNVFSIVDDDNFDEVNIEGVDRMISEINTEHVEVGVLKPNQNLALGLGAQATDIAIAINSQIEDPEIPIVLETRIGINLSRITDLGISAYVLRKATDIVAIEVRDREP